MARFSGDDPGGTDFAAALDGVFGLQDATPDRQSEPPGFLADALDAGQFCLCADGDFGRYTLNSLIVAAVVTAGKLGTSLLAAYAFTQFRFSGRGFLYYASVLSMFVPFVSTMLPNYLMLAKWGWLNTYWAVIVPHLADGMGIFLLRQSIRSIPQSILEAARLDGISHLGILRTIVTPVIKPSLVALGILFFVNSWNEYFWPMLVLNQKVMYTLPLALSMFANVEGGAEWGAVMAAATLTALPPLAGFLLARRYVVETFLHSGVKG